MSGERWWGRSRGLPRTAYRSWQETLAELPGRPARILAWTRTTSGFCIGSPAVLSIGDESGFSHLGWHEIEHGGWNAETRRLSWARYPAADGRSRRGHVELVEPARLPELFRERVAASIVVEQYVGLTSAAGGVTVSARRDLAGAADRISWHVTPTRGTDWRSETARAEAERILARVRLEYDSTPAGW